LTLKFKESTTTIPIVGILGDPVRVGIVPSLARPGGNIAGVTVDPGVAIFSKRLEFLKEVNPAISKVGILTSRLPFEKFLGTTLRDAVKTTGGQLMWPIDGPLNEAEYRRAFSAMVRENANGIIVTEQNENWTYRRLIVELASAIYPYHICAELGGLMSYGMNIADLGSRVAGVIDRILRGAHPGEIPIYQPTKLELSINLKAASQCRPNCSRSLTR
jgi:putative ABC transport system substrate-binding protein